MADTQVATPPSRRSRLIAATLSVGLTLSIIAALIIFLPRFVSYSDLWDVLKSLSWLELSVLTVVAAINVLTYGPSLMAALPGIRYRPALAATLAATGRLVRRAVRSLPLRGDRSAAAAMALANPGDLRWPPVGLSCPACNAASRRHRPRRSQHR